MSEKNKKKMNRREFLFKIGLGSIGVTIGGGSILSFQYLSPNVLFEPPTKFKAGSPEDFSADSVTLNSVQQVYIVRAKAGYFYSLSAVCTHLGCITNYRTSEQKIACPCHGSIFDLKGEVLSGPAPKPLKHLLIEQNDRGELIVDKGVIVDDNYVLKV
ncbi:MAG: ubiquinol-cytochrome c reductase iron-sulfur subunit [Fidelibacterota bacterium]